MVPGMTERERRGAELRRLAWLAEAAQPAAPAATRRPLLPTAVLHAGRAARDAVVARFRSPRWQPDQSPAIARAIPSGSQDLAGSTPGAGGGAAS